MGAFDDREKLEVAIEEVGRLEREVAALRAEKDSPHADAKYWGELQEARNDIAEYVELTDRQSTLLRGVAAALHGPPPALTMWSHHDLPEIAADMKAQRDAAREGANASAANALEVLATEIEACCGCSEEALQECPRHGDGSAVYFSEGNASLARAHAAEYRKVGN